MSHPVDSKSPVANPDIEVERPPAYVDHSADLDEKAKLSAYKADAIEAENAELKMGVLEAVKLYPMATFWAFIMSSTIVSCLALIPHHYFKESQLTTAIRLWNPTVSS